MKSKKTASILKKFLLFNLTVFSVLGLFTIIYLEAIQPNLVKDRAANHKIIIKNTVDHIERLGIEYTNNGIRTFLLSTRFLFQSLDRVRFYDLSGQLVGDTNILDLDPDVFSRSDIIIQESLSGEKNLIDKPKEVISVAPEKIKDIIINSYTDEIMTMSDTINNNFFVNTLSKINVKNREIGFILVSEQANDILTAVKERKAFIIRTMIAVA